MDKSNTLERADRKKVQIRLCSTRINSSQGSPLSGISIDGTDIIENPHDPRIIDGLSGVGGATAGRSDGVPRGGCRRGSLYSLSNQYNVDLSMTTFQPRVKRSQGHISTMVSTVSNSPLIIASHGTRWVDCRKRCTTLPTRESYGRRNSRASSRERDFEKSQTYPGVFRRRCRGKVVVVTVVGVDNLLLLSATKQDGQQTLEDLRSGFLIKDLREVSYNLRCSVNHGGNARTMTFDQRRYAQKVVERCSIKKAIIKPASPGMAPLSKAEKAPAD